ncbi:ABC transporter ATP-binding protein/permease [Aliarcobacter butzleri]|uniref:ABC transporter ATP-binding protein/permease n=1 Tax=Aliarcobacter butzleri TaxID=28197 RepID=UPI00263EA21C|nr:ABC transporter ATP-binding protein [Aliarcobacter butzleri]MDN5067879.1 ABC transporter ATP-binding protein [Aliarcobacter butzleri]MDN5072719.1 ABC transporter ATP-binding protein [Aliarcobacter butzleri]MDN5121697.1 ABC transporter ATP-binding protein [Aliarcobacter butzleri]
MSGINKLRKILTKKEKINLVILLFMSIFLSVLETVGISAIMPFITLASEPSKIVNNEYSKIVYNFFQFSTTTNFMIFFGLVLIGFYIFRASYSIFYNYLLNKFAFGRFHNFAFRLFKNYTNLPYKRFVKKNSAELVKTIVNESSNLSSYIQSILMMFSEVFTILFLYILLLLVDWQMTLVLTAFLGIKVLFLIFSLRNKIKKEGARRADMQSKFYKILNETFGNFKIIKLIQNEEIIYSEFSNASFGYARANIINNTLNQLPRLSLETIGFGVLVGIVVYILFKYEDTSFVLPVISMYALALYRILPALNRILSSYNTTLFLSKSLDIMYDELSYIPPKEGIEAIEFKEKIELKNIRFEYIKGKEVLENINLTINKGDKIAFIGESGSGKSTLVDLIIGLYKPITGNIIIDELELNSENIRAYRSKVGYIPQSIYLFDGTVAENVAFGYEYDKEKIINVLKKANIYDFLSTKEGIDTKVGDGGIQLSGGQKQRVGIARALYSNPEILVLDEATSALDNETESKIMDEIYEVSNDKTLLIIAHRLSTVERCERKIRLEAGKII